MKLHEILKAKTLKRKFLFIHVAKKRKKFDFFFNELNTPKLKSHFNEFMIDFHNFRPYNPKKLNIAK